jgi:chloramphenicol-sensitive protein RarD
MVFAGVATAVPLLLFAASANRIPMVGLGVLQYVAPILQLACGVLIFHEPMPAARLAGFGLVWIALIIFTVDGIRGARATGQADREEQADREGPVAGPTAATVEPATALHPTGPRPSDQGTS